MRQSIKTTPAENKRKRKKLSQSTAKQCYLLILFPITGFFVFTLYPIVWSVIKSFYFYNQIPSQTRFVGFENYVNLFVHDIKYWKSWITTLEYVVLKLPFELLFTLFLALLLSKKIKGAGVFRGIYFLPSVIAMALSSVIFTNLFQYFGFFNNLLLKLNIIKQPVDWFVNRGTSMIFLTIAGVWQAYGINVLYFSAALTNVPDELYEAAQVDGANSVQKFFHITIPMIAPVFQTIALLAINGTLHTGEFVVVMTNGAPGGATHMVGSYMLTQYVPGFATTNVDVGAGCAMAMINSIIYGLTAFVYTKLTNKAQNLY